MRRSRAVAVAGVVAAAAAPWLGAHHSIAIFDRQRIVEIGGVVTELRWINPHVWLHVDTAAQTAQGVERWQIEMRSPNSMMQEGWNSTTVAAGDRVTVYAYPLRMDDAGAATRRGLFVSVTLPDGSVRGRDRQSFRAGEQ